MCVCHMFIKVLTYLLTYLLLKITFFGFPKVKWLQYTGEADKCTSY